MLCRASAVAAALAQAGWRVRSAATQSVAVVLMNIPILSYGLALGWVSLASGANGAGSANTANSTRGTNSSRGASEYATDASVVAAAAATFIASLLAAPLVAALLNRGRKLTVVTASAAFLVCWVLKLCGGSGAAAVVAARAAAGAAGALAWAAGPLMAAESVSGGASAVGAAAAHNAGLLAMYLAAAARLSHQTVLWWCAGLSAVHCVLFLLVPESPAFLAANGRPKEAASALARLHATSTDDPRLAPRLAALPPCELVPASLLRQAKELMRDRQRRRALLISCVAVLGQELCGVSSLLQFAQRALAEGGAEDAGVAGAAGGAGPAAGGGDGARGAVLLGAVQLVAALLALPLLDRVGRRPLLLLSALGTGACLLAASCVQTARGALLAAALAADAAGVQTAPYALLADLFTYQYRGCALLLASAAAAAGNAVDVLLFPLLTHVAGIRAALATAALCTFLYTALLALIVPETRARSLEDIYMEIAPTKSEDSEVGETDTKDSEKADSEVGDMNKQCSGITDCEKGESDCECSDKQLCRSKQRSYLTDKSVSVVEGTTERSAGVISTKC